MNKKKLELSIIITLYNRRELGLRALQSALNLEILNKLNVEIIVIDDGSIDNPLELLEYFINGNDVKYFYKDNGGAASAKNFGAKKALGKYILFLDSDDYFDDKYALDELPSLIGKKPDLITGSCMIVKKDDNEFRQEAIIPNKLYEYCLEYPLNYVGVHPYIFKRSSFLGVGGLNENHRWGDAISFWRIFTKSVKVQYLSKACYVYDQSNENSVSRSKGKSFYSKVLTTISESYDISKKEIDAKGYTFNWGLIILALSILAGDKRLFFYWLSRVVFSPIKSIKSVIFLIKKRIKK